jgi:hypothetical protein
VKKVFSNGDRVIVHEPDRRAFTGTYCSEYRYSLGGERRICVQNRDGDAVAYLLRYVTLVPGQRHSPTRKRARVKKKK